MTFWRADQSLMEFYDEHPDCGFWYRLDQTTSQFHLCKRQASQSQADDRSLHVMIESTEFDTGM